MTNAELQRRLREASGVRQQYERAVNLARKTYRSEDYEAALQLNITYTTMLDGIIAAIHREQAA